MFRSSFSRSRLLVATGATALVVIAGGATPAQAVSKTLNYQCKYPILGTEPLSITVDLDVPERWNAGVDTPPFAISAVATAAGDTVPGLALIDDLASIEGTALASTTVFLPRGGSLKVNVPITIDQYVLPTPAPNPLVLTASGLTPSLTFDEPGRARIALDKIALNLLVRDSVGVPIVLPPVTRDVDGVAVSPSDSDPNTFDVYCTLEPGQAPEGQSPILGPDFEIWPPEDCDCEAIGAPTEGQFTPEDFGDTWINLRWGPPAGLGAASVAEYIIRYEGNVERVPGTQLSKRLDGLSPDSEYVVEISAVDSRGNEGDRLELLLVTRASEPPNFPPTRVTGLTGTATETAVTLSWSASTDANGAVASYNVYNGATKVASVTGTTATVSGLTPDRAYTFNVEAVDNVGQISQRSEDVQIKTRALPVSVPVFRFTLKGSTSVKTLTKGTLPLSGSLDSVNLVLATGQLSGDLTLADTQGRLTALGFLPVTAKIGFVPSGRTTGSLIDGVLKTKSLIRIKVKEVKLFGAIPLAGGNSCQTKSLSEINLQSTEAEFNPLSGGPIAGTYRVSDLNGCGVLNGLVSPLTAGAGNTINAVLAPKL